MSPTCFLRPTATKSGPIRKACLILGITLGFAASASAQTKFIYMSPTGDDAKAGDSIANAVKSFPRAQQLVRALPRPWIGNVNVRMLDGTYFQTQTISFTPADGGLDGYSLAYTSFNGSKPVISGGVRVTGWQDTTINGKPGKRASISLPDGMRVLIVNGKRKQRARSETMQALGFKTDGGGKMNGIVLDKADLKTFSRPQDMELWQYYSWRHFIFRVNRFESAPGNRTILWGHTNRIHEGATFAPENYGAQGSEPAHLENAIELCDEPGEWFYDRTAQTLYYIPEGSESLDQVYVPKVERLVEIRGNSLTDKVRNLEFSGLTFAHAACNALNRNNDGWMAYGAGHLVRNQGSQTGLTPANIYATRTNNLRFVNNTFVHMGGLALYLQNGITGGLVSGNAFKDVSDAGLALGNTQNARYGGDSVEEVPKDVAIQKNLFYRTCVEYRESAPFISGPAFNCRFNYNHIEDAPYLGIGLVRYEGASNNPIGKWTIRYNRIIGTTYLLKDGGSIYIFQNFPSDPSFVSVVSDNHLSGHFTDDGGHLYFDNATQYWTAERNVVEGSEARWLMIQSGNPAKYITVRNNFSETNAMAFDPSVSTGSVVENTTIRPNRDWSGTALTTISNAGLGSSHGHLLALREDQNLPAAAPTVDAGTSISVPVNELGRAFGKIDASATRLKPVHYQWSQVSGPGYSTFYGMDRATLKPKVAFSDPGVYTLRLTAYGPNREKWTSDVTVNVFGSFNGKDLIEGLPVSAFTAERDGGPGNSAAKAFDGDWNTLWWAGSYGRGWVQVDLGSSRLVTRVEILDRLTATQQPSWRELFHVSVANNPDFSDKITLASHGRIAWYRDPNTNATTRAIWTLPLGQGITARYVRYEKPTGWGALVTEMFVYGAPTGPVVRPVVGEQQIPIVNVTAIGSEGVERLNDGNPGTYMLSKADTPKNIDLDIGKVVEVRNIGVNWEFETSRQYRFDVEASIDGINWTKLLVNKWSALNSNLQTFQLPPVPARYVRYVNTGCTHVNLWTHITEMKVNGVIHVPQTATLKFPTQWSGGTWQGQRAFDGNVTTWTIAGYDPNQPGYTIPPTLEMDLGKLGLVETVSIKWDNEASRRYRFTLQASIDGLTWMTVWPESLSEMVVARQDHALEGIPAKYLRYTGLGSTNINKWMYISEIEVYGNEAY